MSNTKYETPVDLFYSKEHEWLRTVDKSTVIVGITDYAVKSLHDVIYVSLPNVDLEVKQNSVLGSVESIKAVSDIYCPISGRIVAVNAKLTTHPEIINESPYKDGWIVKITPRNLDAELSSLMKPEKYVAYVNELVAQKS